MKGVILFYSSTGNTLLACKYLAAKLAEVDFDFCDILKQKKINLDNYAVVGFATFTKEWEPPEVFIDYINNLEKQNQKPAFLLNTYGFISGKTLRTLHHHVTARGFLVMCGHSLNTPENTPPMIRAGLGGANHPGKRKLKKFRAFIISLSQYIGNVKNNMSIHPRKIRIGILNRLLPPFPWCLLKMLMGEKKVDKKLCTTCGRCKTKCPGPAISLNPLPVFNDNKCYYCWACYNTCPEKAIYTSRYKDNWHYPGPNERLKKKLERG